MPATLAITIDVRGNIRVFDSPGEAAAYVRGLAEEERRARGRLTAVRHAVRDARLALGCALLQSRGQVPHGEWREWLREAGLHCRTAQRAMLVAQELATPDGRLDLEAVERVRRRRAGELSADPRAVAVLNAEADEISLHGLELLVGSRHAARPNGSRNANDRSHLNGRDDTNEGRNANDRSFLTRPPCDTNEGRNANRGSHLNGRADDGISSVPGHAGESRRAPVGADLRGRAETMLAGLPPGPRRADAPGQMPIDFGAAAARVHDAADRLLAAVREGRLDEDAVLAALGAAERFVTDALISLSSSDAGGRPDGRRAGLRACAPA